MANYLLSYDVETTGLPMFDRPSEEPGQPHMVQLAARLVDVATRRPTQTLNAMIRPDGWEIPEAMTAIHGITTEHATKFGIPEAHALLLLDSMWRRAAFRLAFNEQFDSRILRIAYFRYISEARADEWKAGEAKCSARMATPIVAMPPTDKMMATGRKAPKMPKLTEAYRHFSGVDMDGAHDALADVDASTAIYFAIEDLAGQNAIAAITAPAGSMAPSRAPVVPVGGF